MDPYLQAAIEEAEAGLAEGGIERLVVHVEDARSPGRAERDRGHKRVGE